MQNQPQFQENEKKRGKKQQLKGQLKKKKEGRSAGKEKKDLNFVFFK